MGNDIPNLRNFPGTALTWPDLDVPIWEDFLGPAPVCSTVHCPLSTVNYTVYSVQCTVYSIFLRVFRGHLKGTFSGIWEHNILTVFCLNFNFDFGFLAQKFLKPCVNDILKFQFVFLNLSSKFPAGVRVRTSEYPLSKCHQRFHVGFNELELCCTILLWCTLYGTEIY